MCCSFLAEFEVISGTTKYCFPSAYLPSGHLKWVLGNPEFFNAFDGFLVGASKTNAAHPTELVVFLAFVLLLLFVGEEDAEFCEDCDSLSFRNPRNMMI